VRGDIKRGVLRDVQPGALSLLVFIALCTISSRSASAEQIPVRVMSANLTSGNDQNYDPGEGLRIIQGLDPDIVLIQEFNYGDNSVDAIRGFVDGATSVSHSYYRELEGSLPNGVISRYPILDAGEWDDKIVSNRDFAWARIDIPGPIDLWVISVHLLTSSSGDRNSEAKTLNDYILLEVPEDDYVIIGGDFNTSSRTESCIETLSDVVVTTGPYPADQDGVDGTNSSRSKPYDWVLTSSNLLELETPVRIGSSSFSNGLVFDSRVYSPLADVAPVQYGDSDSKNMQHMGVVRDFLLTELEPDSDQDGYAVDEGDCNDADATIYPGALERADGIDNDCDLIIDEGTFSYDDDGDTFTEVQGDCHDADATLYPDAPELEDGIDNDCDLIIDEGTFSYDDDGDTFTEMQGDCNDADGVTYPGAPELEDGLDNDCDQIVDEGTHGYDDDGDTFTEAQGDCNDDDASLSPGAPEWEDGIDNDCDQIIDEGTWSYDDDGDTFTEAQGDCNDANASIHPGAPELEDGLDNDCDGSIDPIEGPDEEGEAEAVNTGCSCSQTGPGIPVASGSLLLLLGPLLLRLLRRPVRV